MEEIKYHPLINGSRSRDMIPMFFTLDKNNVATKFYLMECVSHYFRLCSKESVNNEDINKYDIHCPYCGKVMKAISTPTNTYKHSLYVCNDCKNNDKSQGGIY